MIQYLLNRLLHALERFNEERIYPDEGGLRFLLPKGLDPRDHELFEQGIRTATRQQIVKPFAINAYFRRQCYIKPFNEAELDEIRRLQEDVYSTETL